MPIEPDKMLTDRAENENYYESPDIECRTVKKRVRPRAKQTIFFGLAGAFLGYVTVFIHANLEDWQFYTVRSFFTGKKAMSQITQHPADKWVCGVLFFGPIFCGMLLGFYIARRLERHRALASK